MTDIKQRARARVEADGRMLVDLSHRIHQTPELGWEEERAAAWLCDALESGGMTVERGVHGFATAFRSTAGTAGPNVVICAEYDALPEIGHACGHNIIGSSAVGAGLALSELADDLGIRVTVLGTPAEEGGGGKVELINSGAFEEAAVALMVHPAPLDVVDIPSLAVAHVTFTFHGRESHASAFPELGLNALDAMNIAYTAVGALRQHIRSSEKIHGIITHGGDAPNVIPKRTESRYYVRAQSLEALEALKPRVVRCFEAGALATGCELEVNWQGHDYERVTTNLPLAGIYEKNINSLGRSSLPRSFFEKYAGSTDMGNVSAIVPSIHPLMGIDSLPAVNHQADFADHTVSPAGDKAVTEAALAMAWTVIDLATTPHAFEEVVDAFENPPAEGQLSL